MEQRMNHERYADPTAEKAISRVMREQKNKNRKENEKWIKEQELKKSKKKQ